MKKLLFIFLFSKILIFAQQSPHGAIKIECINCHSTDDWIKLISSIKFDHSTTRFFLFNQHRNINCKDCHVDLKFYKTPTECIACHKKDFDATVSISHKFAGFSTNCLECHQNDALSWQTNFDHNKTEFPTRGAHDAVACKTCHKNNQFKGVSTKCIACHQKEFDETQNPSHKNANFSVDCATCHRALTWIPAALFPHDNFFPISPSSRHRPGRWNGCVDCHTAQPNYKIFECINCHEHNKSDMDKEHDDENGYIYQSSACYNCHPQGNN